MKKIRVIETNMAKGNMLKEAAPLKFVPDKKGPDGNEGDIFNIYDQVQYQEILGFGKRVELAHVHQAEVGL